MANLREGARDGEPHDPSASNDDIDLLHPAHSKLGRAIALRPMLISALSIHRPVFASVLSMMLLVIGLIGLARLWQDIRDGLRT